MSVSEISTTSPTYECNGVVKSFSFDFKVHDPSHVVVTLTDAGGREYPCKQSVDYTVTARRDFGGIVTFFKAPAVRHFMFIKRDVPAKQEIELQNQGAYFPEDVERALDLGVMHAQQQDEAIDRCIKLASAATAAKGVAEEVVEDIRHMMSPSSSWVAFGSWLGVPQVIDCGDWREPGGASVDLGERFDGKQIIDCGYRFDTFTQRRIGLESLIDNTTYVLDLGERP